ncbi:MAG TPA: ATP-binding protein, partial [Rhodopila sp.]
MPTPVAESSRFEATDASLDPASPDADARLRRFVECAPVAIAMFDAEMRYLAVSRRFASEFRLGAPSSLIGRCHYDVFPEISDNWRAIHRRVLAGESLSSEAEPFARADGWTDRVRWEMAPWRRPDDTIGGATLFAEAVTLPVAEWKALQEGNERLRLAAASGDIGIWDWNIDSNVMTWDARMYALYGTHPSAGKETYDIWVSRLHPNDRAAAKQAVADAVAGTRPFRPDFRVVWDDGSVHDIRAAGLVTRDTTGRAVRMTGINRDVTEQKRAEATRIELEWFRRTTDMFRSFAEGMPELCWMGRPDGHIYWYNQRWYDYTGTTPADMEGWGWQSVHDPDILPAVLERWRTSIATGVAFEMTFPLRGADGVFRPFQTRIAPALGPDGKVRRWLGINVDVSKVQETNIELEKRSAQLAQLTSELAVARDRAEQASLAKSRFLAGMSHEMRTPLNGVLGYAHILRRDGGLTAAQSARVDAMVVAGNHLLNTINSVLTMSEIEADRVDLHLCEIDLLDVAAECCEMVAAVAEAKHLSLGHSVMQGAPRKLTTDPTRLRQVLLNLLGNAVKFTTAGSVQLRLRPNASSNGLRIEVADTGPGIPVEQRRRLFQAFQRLDDYATASIEGSGLGLAVSAKLVTLIGGRIGIDDNPGGGSVFWVDLPLAIAAPRPHPTAAAATPAVAHDQSRPLRVLVADDVEMNREIVQSFLSDANHEVTCVEDGAEAVAA